MVEEAELDRCCQKADMRAMTEATKHKPTQALVIGLEGKGLTSCSDPSESTSECHPGNVAMPRMAMNDTMTQMYLDCQHMVAGGSQPNKTRGLESRVAHKSPSNTTSSLNFPAT